jgi:DNA repair photolyase
VVEFAPLILTLYAGCSHNCWYCYNRIRAPDLPYNQPAKKASLGRIQDDLDYLKQKGRNSELVLISNMGDPYDMGRKGGIEPTGIERYMTPELKDGYKHTRTVLEMFREYDHPFAILTKGNMLAAANDFDLYGPSDWFGVTLTFDNPDDSMRYEPRASLPKDRIKALVEAKNLGIHTWVSMEPVIDPDQTLNLIELTHEFVDHFRVGKLNHFPEIEAKIKWPKFRRDVATVMQKCGKAQYSDETRKGYKFKHQLIDVK